MIDLHTHLDLYPNALEIISRVNSENDFTLAVTTSPRAWLATKKVFSGYENIQVALGLHPEIVAEKFNELDLLLASISQTNFIGEIGLDGSSRYAKSFTQQELIFDIAIRECQKAGGRLISIHSRAAASKVLSILKKYPNCGQPVLHWFSGSITELKEAIEMKCFFSINPIMVKSNNGKNLISKIPRNLVLPESDGPFTMLNGKPIMPWEAINVCSDLSQIWNIPISDTEDKLKNNFKYLGFI
ncbi:TatD family hydrolase [Methylosoma difficile]